MNTESFVFIAIFLSANAYFAYRASILYRLAVASRGAVWGGNRIDRIPERISTFFLNVLGQAAVLRKKSAGIMHALIFWGFLVITIGTVELFVKEVYPPASFEFMGDLPYGILAGLQDTFSLLVLLALGYAAYRRNIQKPAGLVGHEGDANLILSMISGLMLSLIAMNAFRMVADPQKFDPFLWVSNFFSQHLAGSIQPETAHVASTVFRWIHLALVLGFLMYIPRSKHLHVLAAGPNTFFRPLDIAKPMSKVNLEDESASSFGAAKVTDLSWKDTLDGYACTECGRCQDACPAWNTGKPLSPKKLVLWLKDELYENQSAILSGKTDEVKPILNDRITDDFIWACTSCRACEAACPVFIEQTNKIYDIRRNMVLMESRFPAELNTVFKNIENNFSPWAMSPEDRGAWASDLEVKTMAQIAASGEAVEYLFWVGCAGSYDDRSKKVSRALVNIMRKAGIKFAILGSEEKCTGDPARRAGNEYLAQTLIKENVETLNRYGVKKVVTACPHCFNAIQNEWKDFGGSYEVIHHSQLLAQLIEKGAIKPKTAVQEQVTLHDSCYLGRWNGEYDAPRKVLSSIPSLTLTEMPRNKSQGMCCGAGGGRMWMEETIGTRVNVARTEEALATNSKVIAANCPFCITMMTDGVKAKDAGDKVQVKDIAELIDQST